MFESMIGKNLSIIGWGLPYTAKLSSRKIFAFLHKIHYSLENFCGTSGRGHQVLYTASDSRGKLLRSAKKQRKFSHSKVLPYAVYFAQSSELRAQGLKVEL